MKRILFVLAAAVALPSIAAAASNLAGNVSLTATVASTCTITTASPTIALGTYNPANPSSGSTTVNFQCTKDVAPTGVALGNGSHVTGGTQRNLQLASGTDLIPYSVSAAAPTGTSPNFSVVLSATAPAGAWVTPGSYSDTVTMTVNF